MFEGLSEAVKQAAFECLQHEQETGNEMSVQIDEDGIIIQRTFGEKAQTNVSKKLSETAIVVHNHPSIASLSTQDLQFAAIHGVEIYAVCKDGSWFRSNGLSKTIDCDIDDPLAFLFLSLDEMNFLKKLAEVNNRTLEKVDSLMIGEEQNIIWRAETHLINKKLNQVGLLNGYEFYLGKEFNFLNSLHGLENI